MKATQAVNAGIKMEKNFQRFEARNKIDTEAVELVPILDKKINTVLERFAKFNDRISETVNKLNIIKDFT